jgi:hypothetical protein
MRDERRSGACTDRNGSGLATGVTSADDDDVER